MNKKSHTGLCPVNNDDVRAHQFEFGRGIFLPIGIDVMLRCHIEDISCHIARNEFIYHEWISSNDIEHRNNAAC